MSHITFCAYNILENVTIRIMKLEIWCIPSPIARVMSEVLFFMRATIPAFCKGATRQHNTTVHLLATWKSWIYEEHNQKRNKKWAFTETVNEKARGT